MHEKKVGSVIITDSDGVLIGMMYRKDAEERLNPKQAVGEHI
ncbi:MAG TPA: hypothetical protein VFR47_14350 [Anaerolineales bacterium]|nr:hypothetical protein [Anaerolineales bacterium]